MARSAIPSSRASLCFSEIKEKKILFQYDLLNSTQSFSNIYSNLYIYKQIKVISTSLDLMSQLRGVMKRTGSESRSIPFSNPAAAARALPACHKWPTNRKNPRTK